jgi:hypothetical protein
MAAHGGKRDLLQYDRQCAIEIPVLDMPDVPGHIDACRAVFRAWRYNGLSILQGSH